MIIENRNSESQNPEGVTYPRRPGIEVFLKTESHDYGIIVAMD